MKFKNLEIEKLYEYLSQISREAYKDPLLISNIIFSKQEFHGHELEAYFSKEEPPDITLSFMAQKLLLYLTKNIFSFALLVITAIFHKISGQGILSWKHYKSLLIDSPYSLEYEWLFDNVNSSKTPSAFVWILKPKKKYDKNKY